MSLQNALLMIVLLSVGPGCSEKDSSAGDGDSAGETDSDDDTGFIEDTSADSDSETPTDLFGFTYYRRGAVVRDYDDDSWDGYEYLTAYLDGVEQCKLGYDTYGYVHSDYSDPNIYEIEFKLYNDNIDGDCGELWDSFELSLADQLLTLSVLGDSIEHLEDDGTWSMWATITFSNDSARELEYDMDTRDE